MSAEDRAERLIRYVLNAYPPEHLAAETAQAAQGVMRALSSEGLAVVAREDQLTAREMGLVYMDVDEFDDYFGGQYGIELQDLERKLRRLASRETDG